MTWRTRWMLGFAMVFTYFVGFGVTYGHRMSAHPCPDPVPVGSVCSQEVLAAFWPISLAYDYSIHLFAPYGGLER
jgi:hypothetical protein